LTAKEHRVEIESNTAHETYRATAWDWRGRRLSLSPDPYTPPELPEGTINANYAALADVRTSAQPAIQGYNAEAAVNGDRITIVAEVTIDSPDFGHLEPLVNEAVGELHKVGVTELLRRIVADAGYWHKQQMEKIVAEKHSPVLILPSQSCAKAKTHALDGT
jgi:hypothetical protein